MVRAAESPDASAGLYLLRHLPSGRIYIGQSRRVEARIRGHFKALHKGKHPYPELQSAFDADGESSFAAQRLPPRLPITTPTRQLIQAESDCIVEHLRAGHLLFNHLAPKTSEGIAVRTAGLLGYPSLLTPTDQRIRDAIREAMTSNDPRITQAQLAERLGISQPAVAALITGQRGGIPQSLLNLLEELGLKLVVQPYGHSD